MLKFIICTVGNVFSQFMLENFARVTLVVYVFKASTVREMSCVQKGVNVNEEECLNI